MVFPTRKLADGAFRRKLIDDLTGSYKPLSKYHIMRNDYLWDERTSEHISLGIGITQKDIHLSFELKPRNFPRLEDAKGILLKRIPNIPGESNWDYMARAEQRHTLAYRRPHEESEIDWQYIKQWALKNFKNLEMAAAEFRQKSKTK